MTGDELLCEVRRRQGFVVIGSRVPVPDGTILKNSNDVPALRCGTPMRVVGRSTRAEMEAQRALASEILGEEIRRSPGYGAYFYRVEAAD